LLPKYLLSFSLYNLWCIDRLRTFKMNIFRINNAKIWWPVFAFVGIIVCVNTLWKHSLLEMSMTRTLWKLGDMQDVLCSGNFWHAIASGIHECVCKFQFVGCTYIPFQPWLSKWSWTYILLFIYLLYFTA